MAVDWATLYQLADSAFPTGGFAHSGGLESACQCGAVIDSATLADFIEDNLDQFGQAILPFFNAAWRAPEDLADLDRWYDATVPNHVANRSSRALGHGFLSSSFATFGRDLLGPLKQQVRRDQLPGHLPTISGAVLRALDIPVDDAQRLAGFMHLRTLISSAIRLGVIGPLEAQALQHRHSPHLHAVLLRYRDLSPAEAATSAPLHDIFHGHHDRLYSRLFMS